MAVCVEGMIARVEKICAESDHEESELYQELQNGIEAVSAQVLKTGSYAGLEGRLEDRTEMAIELLENNMLLKELKVLEAATIKLRAIALGR